MTIIFSDENRKNFIFKARNYVLFISRTSKRYFSLIVVIYVIYNCYDYYYITKPFFIIMLIISLTVHIYSVWENNEINYSLREKFKEFSSLIRNPFILILILIIGLSIRFCIRYYFCIDFQEYYILFLVLYISILPVKYLTYVIVSIRKGFKINLLWEGVIFSFMNYNNQVTLFIIWYSLISLFKSKVPFIIIFKWSDIDCNNILKFILSNRQFLIRGNLVKINFEYLFWEIRKIIPIVNIKPKCSLNILGDTVPVITSIGETIQYPIDQRFAVGASGHIDRTDYNAIEYYYNTYISRTVYNKAFNKGFRILLDSAKVNEPHSINPFYGRELQAIANTSNV